MTNDVPDWSTQIIRPDTTPSGSPWTYGATGGSQNFTILKGSHVFTVVVPDFSHVSLVTVTGVTSGQVYLKAYPIQDILPRPYYVIISSEIDSSVTVAVTATASATLYAASVGDVPAVAIAQQEALPWQASNQPPAPVNLPYPGAAGTVLLIAAPSSPKSLWLHSISLNWSVVAANTNCTFETTAGNPLIQDVGATELSQRYYSFHGCKLPSGEGVQLLGVGAAAASASTLLGSITYSAY